MPDSYMRHVGIARTKARLAFLRGQRDRAAELQRELLQRTENRNMALGERTRPLRVGLLVAG
jgi:hypothetical protein